jgi:hypothetical protein
MPNPPLSQSEIDRRLANEDLDASLLQGRLHRVHHRASDHASAWCASAKGQLTQPQSGAAQTRRTS